VNNFAAAPGSRWPSGRMADIRWTVFPPRRARSANVQSPKRLWAYRPARRAGLDPL